MTDRRPRHSLHQRLLQPLRKRVDHERTRQPRPLLPLSNQREPQPQPHSHRAAVTALPTAGTTANGLTATSSSMAFARSRCGSKRRRRRPRSPHELPAWMGSTRGAVPTPECEPNFALFILWKSAKKNLHQAHPGLQEHELERAKKRMNSVLGENLGGLHQR